MFKWAAKCWKYYKITASIKYLFLQRWLIIHHCSQFVHPSVDACNTTYGFRDWSKRSVLCSDHE